jgi:hypothetical protein
MSAIKESVVKIRPAYDSISTDEELDFIINCDINFRMGRDSGEGGVE